MYSTIELGVVCPMANERETAVSFVSDVLSVCAIAGFRSVALFVVLDNVSRDGTVDLIRSAAQSRPELRLVWAPENRSVVDAYVRGYREALAAGSDWILEIDAGYSHRPEDIPPFFRKMAEGYDCVFGSRFMPGGAMRSSSVKRKFISRAGSSLSRFALGMNLTDMTSGFQLFRRPVLETILRRGLHARGPFFQTEMKAYCCHLRVVEVPIVYSGASHSIGGGEIGDSFSGLWRLYRLKLQGGL